MKGKGGTPDHWPERKQMGGDMGGAVLRSYSHLFEAVAMKR